jgi:class 3 adenylate cyclase/tetratricopeptide (TPR) repeat protein
MTLMGDSSPRVEPTKAATPDTASAADRGIEALRRLNAGAPAPLASRVRKARLVGERKPVTAVFADIVGSTSLAERIDPEDWTLIINAAFDEMSRCIFDYEGTIAQLQGDAIISFFGAPVAHEDDPERAVRAALAMTSAMEGYRAEVSRSHDIDFRIRVGISTGLVLVGNVGSDLRYDYTAIGDTMNMASRLEGAAGPGQVLVADRTERFVRHRFELEDIGSLDLKGKAAGVQAFRVIGERAEPGPSRGIEGLTSPMVGRDRELQQLLASVATVRAGRGRSAVIIAEPGLGKSRLLRELQAEVARLDAARGDDEGEMAWAVGFGSPYGTRMPFHLATNLIVDLLGLTAANSPTEIELALRTRINELLPRDAEARAYLTFLMGLDAVDREQRDIAIPTGEFLSERLTASVMKLLSRVAQQGPLGIVIEDLHWADPASVDLVKAMLTLVDDEAVLMIFLTREEPDSPGWDAVNAARDRGARALAEIHLEPLPRLDSEALIANLLEIESLAPATRQLILEKAEGNPFFVEEVIRMLIDRRLIEYSDGRWRATGIDEVATIPDTLQGLILARIDRLPPEARQVLRIASCIERQFPLSLLEDVVLASGGDGGIAAALGQLEGTNLLDLAGTEPELTYRFSHALVQDAAYETVLRQERREWHALVAAAVLARYPEREAEMADQLARHFELAGDSDRAVRYLLIAADRALARNAMLDAGGLYRHARSLLPDDVSGVAGPDTDRRRLRVLLGTVASGFELMGGDAAYEILQEAAALARRVGDDASLSDVLFWEISLRQTNGERPEDSEALRAALDQMQPLGDVTGNEVQRAQALARSGVYLWWSGEFERSFASLEQASALFRKQGDVIGASMTESYMAADLASTGSFEEADLRMQESRALSESADALSKLDFHLAEAAIAGIRGDFGTSMRFAGECFASSAELGALGCATVSGMVLGSSQMALGEIADARASVEMSIEHAAQSYLAPMRLRGQVLLAAVHGVEGDMGKAEDGFRVALEGFVAMGGNYGKAEALRARGMVHATHPAGDPGKAVQDLDAAADSFTALGAKPALARTYRARGLALARLGNTADADASLSQAASMASDMWLLDGPWPATVVDLEAARAASTPLRRVD